MKRLIAGSLIALALVAWYTAPAVIDLAHARACVNQFIRNTSTAEPTCDTVKIDTDTDKKFGGVAVTADGTELNYLDSSTPGTSVASKAAVLGTDKNLDVLALPVSGLKIGAGAGTAVARTAAELNNLAQGVAAGYKLARGQLTLDGSNPTPAATGLATIVNCTASYQGTAAPGLDPTALSVNPNGTNLDVYAWKPTAAGDATLIASTNATAIVSWMCVGT